MKITKEQLREMVQKETVSIVMEMCGIKNGEKKNKISKKEKSAKKLNEWVIKDEDVELINSPEDGKKQYIISLWSGQGYVTASWRVFADEIEPALEKLVAHLEGEGKDIYFCDGDVEAEEERMKSEGKTDEEIEDEIDGWSLYIDATTEGASKPHYLRTENMGIREI